MGRKRKAGALPSPLLPSSSISRASFTALISETTTAHTKFSDISRGGGGGSSSVDVTMKANTRGKRRVQVNKTQSARTKSPKPSLTMETSRRPGDVAPYPAVTTFRPECDSFLKTASTKPTKPSPTPRYHSLLSEPNIPGSVRARDIPMCDGAGLMTPAQVLKYLVPQSGWRLGSCWGVDGCNCKAFYMAPPRASSMTLEIEDLRALCSCGHRSSAHELTDTYAEGSTLYPPSLLYPVGNSDASARGNSGVTVSGAAAIEARRLRLLFSSIRNARALGDSNLFQDSEGVSTWGTGWFLTRRPRQYLQEARRALAGLREVLHDPATVTRCLSTAERLMAGNEKGDWAMPDSLFPSSVYQALGTGIAAELDRAYWHVRYTAASRFHAQGVTSTAPSVIPPPEVYFVCLASCLPLVRDLRTHLGRADAALRQKMVTVLDFPLDVWERRDVDTIDAVDSQEIAFPVLTNPLLAVTQANWLETAISVSAESWVPHFPPQFGQPEGTMRGSDPALPRPIRAWCDVTRDWSARMFAFAVPNRRAVLACKKVVEACGGSETGLIEVGAGLGYWKWLLEGKAVDPTLEIFNRIPRGSRASEQGDYRSTEGPGLYERRCVTPPQALRVLALDQDPTRLPFSASPGGHQRQPSGRRNPGSSPARANPNEYHGGAPSWAQVKAGGPKDLRSLASSDYPVLLLCYPPPSLACGSSGGACMGADTLENFAGKVLLYAGEVGGDTGSPRMEAILQRSWNLIDEVELPCFPTTANRLMIFARKESSSFSSATLSAEYADVCAGNSSRTKVDTPSGVTLTLSKNSLEIATVASNPTPEAESPRAGVKSRASGAGGAQSKTPLAMYRCTRCRRGAEDGVRLHMCRLTRAVTFCSEQCLREDLTKWQANLRVRHIHLASRRKVQGAIDDASLAYRDKKMFRKLNIRPSACQEGKTQT